MHFFKHLNNIVYKSDNIQNLMIITRKSRKQKRGKWVS